MKPPIARVREAGLSLVEVLIAVALLSAVLVTLIMKVHDCIDTARVTENQNAAREYSKELMAQVEAGLIDGLIDGYQGDFSEQGYPQIRYSIGLGENSQVALQTSVDNPNATNDRRRLYTKQANDGGWIPMNGNINDPSPTTTDEENQMEEPFTRVRIAVQFPTSDDEKFGMFVLERLVATECTKGAAGLREKAQKDSAAAQAEESAGAAPGAAGQGGGAAGGGAAGKQQKGSSSGGGSLK